MYVTFFKHNMLTSQLKDEDTEIYPSNSVFSNYITANQKR